MPKKKSQLAVSRYICRGLRQNLLPPIFLCISYNIMIRQDGTPKILDFGLAHIERGESVPLDSDMPTMTMDSDVPASLTQGKGFMGTPSYMSPEQIEGGT